MKIWTINSRKKTFPDLFVWSFVFVGWSTCSTRLIYMQLWRQTQFLRLNGNVFPHVFFPPSPTPPRSRILHDLPLRMLNSDIGMCHRATNCDHIHIFSCTWFHGKSPFKCGPFFTSDPIWMVPIVKRFPQMWKSTPVNRAYHYLSWICIGKNWDFFMLFYGVTC